MDNILVAVTRGNITENLHRGHICIVDEERKIVASVGDPYFVTYMRSCAKPIQAIPVITTGAWQKFGLTEKEITIFSGSLNGEEFQVDILKNILKKLELSESCLKCGIHPPSHKETRKKLKEFGVLHNNCAGKHIAMLALCRYFDWPIEGYERIEHPVQRLILREIAYFSEIEEEKIHIGIDGCGVPVFALPLYNFAIAYMKFAKPNVIDDLSRKEAVKILMKNALKYPELIAGNRRICTELMRVKSNVFAKVGADGSYGLSLFEKGLGVALKIESGNMRALNVAVIDLLLQTGVLTDEDAKKLEIFYKIPVLNHRKKIVGEFIPKFKVEI
jgi:L-asparaginase II